MKRKITILVTQVVTNPSLSPGTRGAVQAFLADFSKRSADGTRGRQVASLWHIQRVMYRCGPCKYILSCQTVLV